MLYRAVRALIALALRLFYRVSLAGHPLDVKGPLLVVGNHPNGLIDPALLFALSPRQMTFLAKAPLFKLPVLGLLLRGLGAMPVYRKQDDPAQMGRNDATLEAAGTVLRSGGALTLFPEGRSHSEPALGELKTGAARMALSACVQGAPVKVLPVGLTYESKRRFRSEVRVEAGAPIDVAALHPGQGPEHREAVVALTDRIDAALRDVTLNLDSWEDLPLLQTAEALYALEQGDEAGSAERLRAFARGVRLLRERSPERLAALQERVGAYHRRLTLVSARPESMVVDYRPGAVAAFIVRNTLALVLGLPLFALGMVLFFIPYQLPRRVVSLFEVEDDIEATVKLLMTLLLAPVWNVLLAVLAWRWGGPAWGLVAAVGALPLALFTRRFYERRARAFGDARLFLTVLGRRRFRAHLVEDGERIAREVEALAAELPSSPPAG